MSQDGADSGDEWENDIDRDTKEALFFRIYNQEYPRHANSAMVESERMEMERRTIVMEKECEIAEAAKRNSRWNAVNEDEVHRGKSRTPTIHDAVSETPIHQPQCTHITDRSSEQVSINMLSSKDRCLNTSLSSPPDSDSTIQVHPMIDLSVPRSLSPFLTSSCTATLPTPVPSIATHSNNRPCRYYAKSGYCKFGNTCRFSHIVSPKPNAENRFLPTRTQTEQLPPSSISNTYALQKEHARKEQEIASIKTRIVLQEELARTQNDMDPSHLKE